MFILVDGKSQKSERELLRIKDTTCFTYASQGRKPAENDVLACCHFELRKSETDIGFPGLPRKLTGLLPFNGIV